MRGKTKEEAKLSGGASKRSSVFETDRRVGYAESLLANGVRHNTAVVHLREKFQVCKRQAERYVAAVYNLWREQSDGDRRLKMSRAIARRQEVFSRALKDKQYGAAIKALEGLERLEGIAPELLLKHHHIAEVTYKDEPSQSTVDAIREVMSEKETRHALMQKLKQASEIRDN